jgi:hypothetical protein
VTGGGRRCRSGFGAATSLDRGIHKEQHFTQRVSGSPKEVIHEERLRRRKLMTLRWQERKLDDDLLKRELLLRLRAERSAAPGRSSPATDYFRHRVRGLMLRHPLFAYEYRLLAKRPGTLPRPRSRRHARALAAVVAGAALLAAGGAAVVAARDSGSRGTPGAGAPPAPLRPLLIPHKWRLPPRTASIPTVARSHPATHPHRRKPPTLERPTVLVSDTVSRTTTTVPSTGPAPLKSPKARAEGAPRPLGAP